ncbi:choline dehydrogenase [Pseudonocardia sp. C8]|nr:choline dehydrogenase [Pseudonocardia sp. C8]MBC3193403.1 choline dehydrogenase [Pseudonocardia sp. C8]
MAASYDYIVVGAGTAGCILASRLSEDPSATVLLVEAGGHDRNPMLTMPGALPFVYQNTRIGWGYRSGPEPYLDGRTIDEKAGRIIGGGSSINAMIFNRGNPLDYEGWAKDGLDDWDYAHVLPYFRKFESFSDGPDEWRGANGPVHVGRAPAAHRFHDTFLRAGEQAGFPVTPDHNGYRQEGMHIAQVFIHQGVRWSASRAYLRPAAWRPNLTVLARATVERIEIHDGRATGIRVRVGTDTRVIPCEREVILAAGAFNSPKLLLLSGIGPADELARHGIPVVSDRAEVGRNLQNHPGVDVQFGTASEDSLTAELSLAGRAKIGVDWLLRRRGLGATNFFESGAFLRTRDDVEFPNMQYEFLPLTRRLVKGKLVPVPGFQVWMDLSRPESRGSVSLRSANPQDPPSIVFNHLQARQDLEDIVDGVKLTRETLVKQQAWQRFRPVELNPGPDVTSDREIEAFVRSACNTSYHGSGSCRMGVDDDAVVDQHGRVNTIGGLRVADASIMPRVVTANLNAPVMMMAEKLADRIRGITPLPPGDATFYGGPER